MSQIEEDIEDRGPVFYIPRTSNPATYPNYLPDPLRGQYAHLYRLRDQLLELWHVQLKNHRDVWHIKAAHDFWRRHGPPRTPDGQRKLGWNPQGNWILEAIADTERELVDLEVGVRKRLAMVRKVMRGRRKKGKEKVSLVLDTGGGREMGSGFTSNARYQTAARGEQQNVMSTVHRSVLENSVCPRTSSTEDDDDSSLVSGDVGHNRQHIRRTSPQNQIINNDESVNHQVFHEKERAPEEEEEDIVLDDAIRFLREYIQPSPVTSHCGSDNNGGMADTLFTQLKPDSEPRSETAPEEHTSSEITQGIHDGDAAVTAAAITELSRRWSLETTEQDRSKNSNNMSTCSSPSKKRFRDEDKEVVVVAVGYGGEKRCKKSPEIDGESDDREGTAGAPINL